MTELHIDLESRSAIDLKKCGAYVYAEDESTDIWCAAYAFGDEPVKVWRPGEPCPADIFEHVISGGVIVAHNAAFERTMWHYILGPRYGWPEPDVTQWRCTMVMSYAMALPGSLDKAAEALRLAERKDDAGHRLMLQMGRPRKVKGATKLVWWDDPEKVARLIAYCVQDVIVERGIGKRLRPLKQSELDLWHLDQRINDRGVYVDVELCEAAKKIVTATADGLDWRMRDLTGFAVTACSNVNQLVAWMREQGVDTKSIAKDVVEDLLTDKALPAAVREALEIRRESAKASVAKIDALLAGRSKDGRARGLLQFSAASTGRWAGRRFQPQNIKRPDLDEDGVEAAIEIVRTGDVDLVIGLYGEPLSVVGDCLRGMICAEPGNELIAADYKSIESRVLAWLAGEEWKVEAHRASDEGTGQEVYKVIAGDILHILPTEVSKKQRQAYGKIPDLALGYQGGVGAFQSMAVVYGVEVTDEEAASIRDRFRATHPKTKQLWKDAENAAVAAVRDPGSTHSVADGRLVFRTAGSFLFMRLPSGRLLAYAYPQLRWKQMPWDAEDPVWLPCDSDDEADLLYGDKLVEFDPIAGRALVYVPAVKLSVSFMGLNSYTRNWERCFTYGGSIIENAVQAIARDILAAAMPLLEAAGYAIILSVHDELIAEVRKGFGSLEEFIAIMIRLQAWAAGCPIAASGFQAERYHK